MDVSLEKGVNKQWETNFLLSRGQGVSSLPDVVGLWQNPMADQYLKTRQPEPDTRHLRISKDCTLL